ncbi:MAG: hypothetical protein AAGK32_13505, partial [Actinomycetota bacterium]
MNPGLARRTVDVLRATFISWRDARTKRIGAGVAYYALFALVPLLSLSIWLAQLVVDDQTVSASLVTPGAGPEVEAADVKIVSDGVDV